MDADDNRYALQHRGQESCGIATTDGRSKAFHFFVNLRAVSPFVLQHFTSSRCVCAQGHGPGIASVCGAKYQDSLGSLCCRAYSLQHGGTWRGLIEFLTSVIRVAASCEMRSRSFWILCSVRLVLRITALYADVQSLCHSDIRS